CLSTHRKVQPGDVLLVVEHDRDMPRSTYWRWSQELPAGIDFALPNRSQDASNLHLERATRVLLEGRFSFHSRLDVGEHSLGEGGNKGRFLLRDEHHQRD